MAKKRVGKKLYPKTEDSLGEVKVAVVAIQKDLIKSVVVSVILLGIIVGLWWSGMV